MKTKTNIALEGTCNGDVVGGLYREPRENLQALLFGKGGVYRLEKEKKDELSGLSSK
jgi:hypothetical protein